MATKTNFNANSSLFAHDSDAIESKGNFNDINIESISIFQSISKKNNDFIDGENNSDNLFLIDDSTATLLFDLPKNNPSSVAIRTSRVLFEGSPTADFLYGGLGNDTMYGLGGDDYVFGDYGADILYGGDGNDTLDGYKENDSLYGEKGNDYLDGRGGMDYLFGGTGDDTLVGRTNNDFLSGGEGNDILIGIRDVEFGVGEIDTPPIQI